MGIGNQLRPGRSLVLESASLPLMGIGNLAVDGTEEEVLGSHYPSWGSETAIHATMLSMNNKISLPLMGIGNLLLLLDAGLHAAQLITPHGDRKPPTLPRGSAGHALTSLPLMGIGNLLLLLDAGLHAAQLITPHGDRKPPTLPRGSAGHALTSLPLMGIGNLAQLSARDAGHRTSLPLMGIGNQQSGLVAAQVVSLITPHGDRKPSKPSTGWL